MWSQLVKIVIIFYLSPKEIKIIIKLSCFIGEYKMIRFLKVGISQEEKDDADI